MAARTITFNGTSLQTSNIVTSEIRHESMDSKEVLVQRLAVRDGGKFTAESFRPKSITLIGTINGSSIDDLESRIDTLEKVLGENEKSLDIQYSSGTRRYVASCRRFLIERQHFHLTFTPFEIEFIVSNPPFGKAIDTSTVSQTITSVSTSSFPFVPLGTRRPLPLIRITFLENNDVTSVTVRNATTGDSITVDNTTAFGSTDVIEIDTDNYTVQVNESAHSYTGFFPDFDETNNNMKVSFSGGTTFKATAKLIYRALYL